MEVGSSIPAIVASLDLQLVRSLRQAMNTPGPAASGCPVSGLGPVPTRIEPRIRIQPTPLIEPRFRITPTPRIEPRLVYQPYRIEPRLQVPCSTVPAVVEPEQPRITKSPIEPPWKVLPWQNPPPPAPQLKMVIKPPDPHLRGTVLDVFV